MNLPRLRPHRLSALLLALVLAGGALPSAARGECPRVRDVRPVPAAAAGEVAVATQNLRRLFDAVDDGKGEVASPEDYRRQLDRLAAQLDTVLRRPAVVAVQEAEHEGALKALAAVLRERTGVAWLPVLREGHDPGGIDVGYLVRADWQVTGVEQLLAGERLGRHPLFDRPPLWLRLRGPGGVELELLNVHLRSLHGSDRGDGKARRVAQKRQRQAEALARWLRMALALRPQRRLVVLGDFNATPEGLGGVDVLGIVQAAGLQGLWERLPAQERYTYVWRCRPEALDHMLVSPALLPAVTALAASRGNAGARPGAGDGPLGSSDHDALVLYLRP